MISVWTSYNNLAVKVNSGEFEKRDKAKLSSIPGKIPIYKMGKFTHWEIPRTSILDLYNLFSDEDLHIADPAKPLVDKLFKAITKISDLAKEEMLVEPYNKDIDLRDFQRDWITIDKERLGLLCLFQVGLGKTISSLLLAKNRGHKRVIIVCPVPIVVEWVQAILNDAVGPSAKILMYKGTPKQREKLRLNLDCDYLITNYEKVQELVNNDVDKQFDAIIVDEAHQVQNRTTKLYKAMKSLVKRCKGTVQLLTATPIESSVQQLWTLINLINPELAGDEASFLNKFQEEVAWVWKERNGHRFKIPIKFRVKNEAGIKDIIERAGMRVSKSLFINYKVVPNVIPVEMTPKQKDSWKELLEQILIDSQTDGFYKTNPLVRLLDLLKIAEGSQGESGKVEYLKYRVPELDKAIVWSRFRWLPEYMHSIYPATTVLFNGSKSQDYRKMIKWAFEGCSSEQEKEEFYILRHSIKDFAGFEPGSARILWGTYGPKSGAGLNLPSARNKIYVSYDYSSRSYEQASGRNERLNSAYDTLFTDNLVSVGTVETKLLTKIMLKIQSHSRMLDGESSESDLSARDVIDMLRGL